VNLICDEIFIQAIQRFHFLVMTNSWHSHITDYGILCCSGRDSVKFLQGQTTCDIVGLPSGMTTLGALCTAKGRVVAVFRVLRIEERVLIILPADLLEIVRKQLEKYILRSDVQIQDVTQLWTIYGIYGEHSEAVLDALGLPHVAQNNEVRATINPSATMYVIRIPAYESQRFLLVVEKSATMRVSRALDEASYLPIVDPSRWVLENIRAGIPLVLSATSEEFTPQMINLDLIGGVSLTKGCYTGQEIVARTHYLGHLKRRMFRLVGNTVEQPPEVSERIYAGGNDSYGIVVNAAQNQDKGFDILAVLAIEQAQDPKSFFFTYPAKTMNIVKLPYRLPKHEFLPESQ
jgi:folate-binding protein YgfZ